jgi:hypothetical protein
MTILVIEGENSVLVLKYSDRKLKECCTSKKIILLTEAGLVSLHKHFSPPSLSSFVKNLLIL